MSTTAHLSFEDRPALAHAHLGVVFERRGNFLSDDDLLDAADLFTTSVFREDEADWSDGDRERLIEALFALCTEGAD